MYSQRLMGSHFLESPGSSCGGDCCCRSTHGRGTATTATAGTTAKTADAHSDSAADASHPAGMIEGLTWHTVTN